MSLFGARFNLTGISKAVGPHLLLSYGFDVGVIVAAGCQRAQLVPLAELRRIMTASIMRMFSVVIVAVTLSATVGRAADFSTAGLPSWNDGPAKKAIVDFVGKVTKESSTDFVPSAERIATFDNDGT